MTYTAHTRAQVLEMAVNVRDCAWPADVAEYMTLIYPMLTAYAALLKRQAVAVTDVPLGAIKNGRVFADRLESTGMECEAGTLAMCSDWQEFRRCFEFLAEWAMNLTATRPVATEPVAQAEVVRKVFTQWAKSKSYKMDRCASGYTDADTLHAWFIWQAATESAQPRAVPEGYVPDAVWSKLELWFFREVTSAQRLALFALCGLPVDEIGESHINQKLMLRHLLTATPAQEPK